MPRLSFAWMLLVLVAGCTLPQASRQPTVHNPFPQLQKVAVAPFFNLSTEPTVDGRHVALAYFSELQSIPGFEVIPIGVVEKTLEAQGLTLNGPAEARKVAQLLEVDAIVVGAVTDYSPYYPPRFALQVEWYAANPNFHPIPPGYGLPWGTPREDEIPGPLIFEAEMALARAQLKTQTPKYVKPADLAPPPDDDGDGEDGDADADSEKSRPTDGEVGELVSHGQIFPPIADPGKSNERHRNEAVAGGLPPDWPDARGFQPRGPMPFPLQYKESAEPVLRHTRTFNGNDQDLTTALATYVYYRDDARFGGWQSYLQRSDDFIRFCCHMHICEMLTARGGAGETRVVWRWPIRR
ncbi:MAG TPA: hypothetical protein VHC22_05110 [Pirellulales bacterium]|nr:hypothetical protein [Pirellulales bacterium]